ncbi:MAG: YicC family protein, partial [Gammaproteobacteria bacterium]|nr:YicC family protein [Gammaproteobacteria bacterium]
RTSESDDIGTVQWEIRSVNQRFLDMNFRLPEILRHLEMPIREKVRKKLSRGKLDINLKFSTANQSPALSVNEDLILAIQKTHLHIAEMTSNHDKLTSLEIMQWPGVLEEGKTDEKQRDIVILKLFEQTLEQLVVARGREGEAMKQLLLERLTLISEQVSNIRGEFPEILQWQKDRLLDRFKEVNIELDQDRLEQELVYLAQKADIAEELDRLDTHVTEIARILKKGGNVGRRLDFLLQELVREANTLGSKSINKITTAAAVELKVIIEQMREQVQNLE